MTDIKELRELVESGEAIKIAEAGDYKAAYGDFIDFELGFPEYSRSIITFAEFMREFKKGYGKSDYIQIARLFELEDGIYYDNEYVN